MADPWFKFYPTDWRSDPRLRMCGMAARGLWIEMIALMHEATPYGHLLVSGLSPTSAQLAVLAGAPSDQIPDLLGELEAAGVFSRTSAGVIYSRKMTRMAKKAAVARKNGKNGGNPKLRKQTENPTSDIQEDKGQDKPQKPEARSQKEDKRCSNEHLEQPKLLGVRFEDFWSEWPMAKTGRKRAEASFNRLSPENRAAAKDNARPWAERWRRMHPTASDIHPANYLNGRRWEDQETGTRDEQLPSDEERRAAEFDKWLAQRSAAGNC